MANNLSSIAGGLLLAFCVCAGLAADDARPPAWACAITNPDPVLDGYHYAGHAENLGVVLDLLRNGCRVEWIATPPPGTGMRRGDYLVPLDQPRAGLAKAILSAVPAGRRVAVAGRTSLVASPLVYPRILLDAQVWASNYYWYYDTLLAGGFAIEHLYEHDDQSLDPARHNLFVVPGGGGRIPSSYNALLESFVYRGGNYLGSCWGCAQAVYPSKVSYGSGNGAGIADAYNSEKTRSFGALGGIGHIILRNDAPDHPIMWDLPREIHNIYWNGPVMKPSEHSQSLASLVGIVEEEFRFHTEDAQQRRDDVSEEHGKCVYLTSQRPGEGKVIVFGNHPEASNGVNPFPAHAMGYRAVYNAILFGTAGPQRALTIEAPRKHSDSSPVKRTLPENTPAATDDIRRQARQLRELIQQKLGGSTRRWNEDDRSGFYLLRLRDAVQKLEQARAAPPANSGSDARKVRARFERWHQSTKEGLEQLTGQLPALDIEKMNRSSTAWHPLVCPLYERSIEWTHLRRDLEYYRASLASE